MRLLALVLVWVLATACLAQAAKTAKREPYRWTRFMQVEGQPEPVPEEWVSTPEGKFAHSLKVPNPVPKDSGYRFGMDDKSYFEHLCRSEAGEFIFKKVRGETGFLFARVPAYPSDADLMDRYKLEAPDFERVYQLLRNSPAGRSTMFVSPHGRRHFQFVEEPIRDKDLSKVVRVFGFKERPYRPKPEIIDTPKAKYGVTWRGLRRPHDREHFVAGSEWLIFDLRTKEVLGLLRDYALTGFTQNTPQGIWWLNAIACGWPEKNKTVIERMDRYYRLALTVLNPTGGEAR